MFVDSLSQTWHDMVSTIFTNESIIIPLKSNIGFKKSISLVDVYCLADNSVNLSWKRSLRSRELCMWESLFVEVERGLVFSEGEDIKVMRPGPDPRPDKDIPWKE